MLRFLCQMMFIILMLGFSSLSFSETNPSSNQQTKVDTQITSTVKNKISNNNNLNGSNLNVKTVNGVVTLTGNVNSSDQRSLATELAQSVEGVQDVDASKISITNETDSQQPYTDTLITAKVKGMFIQKKLFSNKDIAAMSISVETNNGVVTLSGTADNQAQINNAIKIAKSIKGVNDVKSTVAIQSAN